MNTKAETIVPTIKITHRYTGVVLFQCAADAAVLAMSPPRQMGYAVNEAVRAGANLTDADLTGANLTGADLTGANLAGAYLADAYLADADLTGADLAGADLARAYLAGAYLARANLADANLADAYLAPIKQDFLAEVLRLPNELEALREAIAAGRVDGSTYRGDCACLAGTFANVRGASVGDGDVLEEMPETDTAFSVNSDSPRERFFLAIKKGDTPDTNPASAIALKWTEEAIRVRDMIRASAPGAVSV